MPDRPQDRDTAAEDRYCEPAGPCEIECVDGCQAQAAATPSPGPRFVGEAKLQALADEVFKNGEIDDLEARSILAYIAKLEKQVADFTEIAEEKRLRGINASSRLAEAARRG